jgi:hypothetical protein
MTWISISAFGFARDSRRWPGNCHPGFPASRGQSRRFVHVTSTSASPSTPDIFGLAARFLSISGEEVCGIKHR